MEQEQSPWRLLVVDDDESIHAVTELCLKRKSWRDRGFSITSAYSGREGMEILKGSARPFEVAIIDAVMETPDAGLKLCSFIRSTYGASMRIILRTGQPGIAPEEYVLENYDIDQYLAKGELTAERLFSAVRTSLRAGEDLKALRSTNGLLNAANTKLTRAQHQQAEIVHRILNRETGLLAKLTESIDQGKSGDQLHGLVSQVREILDTQDGQFGTELDRALSRRRILVLLSGKKAVRLTRRAVSGTDGLVVVEEDWASAIELVRKGQVDLVFLDIDHIGFLAEAAVLKPDILAVLLSSVGVFEKEASNIMSLPVASAMVVGDEKRSTEAMDALQMQEMVVTAGKLLSGDIFGIEKYLAWGVRIHERTLCDAQKRNVLLEEMSTFAAECGVRPSVRRRFRALADELIMNALWDAPANPDGTAKYNHLPRNEPLVVQPSEAATVRWGTDGSNLAISVTDNFGRLEREVAAEYIRRCMSGEEQISTASGGAGLGLYLSFRAVSTFILNVERGKRTEAIGLINLHNPQIRPRAFHYFRL